MCYSPFTLRSPIPNLLLREFGRYTPLLDRIKREVVRVCTSTLYAGSGVMRDATASRPIRAHSVQLCDPEGCPSYGIRVTARLSGVVTWPSESGDCPPRRSPVPHPPPERPTPQRGGFQGPAGGSLPPCRGRCVLALGACPIRPVTPVTSPAMRGAHGSERGL